MKQFMEALSIFYPCTYCATDFQDNIKKSPVKTESREGLCVWLCEQHNLVNEKLGNKTFNCDLKSLDERWRKSSDPRC
jgi:mitochondrial FAD-linked sulfhydryl oxidase